MRIATGILLLTIISYACKKERATKDAINGIWESLGSAWVLELKDSVHYTIYDITSISCLPNHKGLLSELEETLQLKNDTLSLLKGVVTAQFVRVEKLPLLCNQEMDDTKTIAPLYNFEIFAETVKEHYAFMELNKINWDELYLQQRSKLNSQSSNIDLYLVIEETLELLNDNHANLDAPNEVFNLADKISEKKENASNVKSLPEYGDFQVAEMVVDHHLQEEMTEDSWIMEWGKLNNEIGYIQVKAMWLYADLDISNQLIEEVGYVDAYVQTFHKMYEGHYVDKEVQAVRKKMDQVMNDLSSMNSIILDVRFNGGGQDAVSFEILSRFTSNKLPVAKQKLKYGDQFTAIQTLYVDGSKNAFLKPVYILTSPQTGSAAEAFSIASMSMTNVKRIGAATAGALSTTLEKTLPNGWSFSISNEIYMDVHYNVYENIGVPVDYKIAYPKDRQSFFRSVVSDLESDRRHILNVIKTLEGK